MFWDKSQKVVPETERFRVYVFIPPSSKPYFYSSTQIDENVDNIMYLDVKLFSNVTNGFKTRSFPATKSLFYKAPYFIKLKNLQSVENYLLFDDFIRTNVKDSILAMVNYHSDIDGFVAEFAPELILPYKNSLPLCKNIEIIIVDSNNNPVFVEDYSQLFFAITIL